MSVVLFHAISAYRDATHYQADLLRNAAEGEFHAQATTNSALDEHGHAAAKLRGLDHEPDAEKRTATYWEQQEAKLLDRPLAAIDLRLPDRLVVRANRETPETPPARPTARRERG